MPLRLSVFGLPLTLLTTSVIGFLASPVAVIASNSVAQPKVGTVVSVAHGDVACYLTLIDEKGIKHEGIPVVFDVCAKEETFLNKKVILAYAQVPINNCPAATDCGKTRIETLITQLKIADEGNFHICSGKTSAGYTIPRLRVGLAGYAVVRANVRKQPGVESKPVGFLEPYINKFKVLQGPECVGNYVWWKVKVNEQLQGWVAEADPSTSNYWLEPIDW
jgi:hypothetical protein